MSEHKQLFGAAPYAKDSDTSKEAAESVEHECTSRIRGLVLATVRAAGRPGMTCDEIEVALGMKHQTASARCNELVDRYRLLVDSGERRPTRSGRKARVLVERGELEACQLFPALPASVPRSSRLNSQHDYASDFDVPDPDPNNGAECDDYDEDPYNGEPIRYDRGS